MAAHAETAEATLVERKAAVEDKLSTNTQLIRAFGNLAACACARPNREFGWLYIAGISASTGHVGVFRSVVFGHLEDFGSAN